MFEKNYIIKGKAENIPIEFIDTTKTDFEVSNRLRIN